MIIIIELRKLVNEEIKTVIVPELRKNSFKGSFPHFRRIYPNGKVDYLSFQFNKYGGSYIVEIAVAYPYKGKDGNFYYWNEVTPEFIKKSNYTYTKDRYRITPVDDEWFRYYKDNYKRVVNDTLKRIIDTMSYFDNK